MDCSLGPAERRFDGIQWLVFGCDDGRSIVFVTGPESPADLQFVFIVSADGDGYKVYGEGNGDRALTKPAYDAIIAMSASEYAALHAEVTAIGPTS